jgi:hypothetical protein
VAAAVVKTFLVQQVAQAAAVHIILQLAEWVLLGKVLREATA